MVRGVKRHQGHWEYEKMPSSFEIIVRVVNSALLKPLFSDCHAEANAISVCAATGTKLGQDVTCYVTKAPCTECFKLLTMARIGRIVCPENYTSIQVERCAKRTNVEWVHLRNSKEDMKKRDEDAAQFEDRERIEALRAIRKRRRALATKQKAIARENRKRKMEEQQRAKLAKLNIKKKKKKKNEEISNGTTSTATSTTTATRENTML